ncbi:hypothetical protein TNCV_3814581 [Trichonephila clavipes]|nr:hypothetical protein TNCV_3814581 [Trichonephila clavipes]
MCDDIATVYPSNTGRISVADVIDSQVRNMLPMKTCRVETLIHNKSAKAQNPPKASFGSLERGCRLKYLPALIACQFNNNSFNSPR